MKLIATDEGRVVQLFVLDEVRPLSGTPQPALFTRLVERYKFLGRPTNYLEAINSGPKFNDGQLVLQDAIIPIKEFAAYRDGLVVSAQTTTDADAILADLWQWLISEFRFREPVTPRPKVYKSAVVIEFDKQLDEAIRGFDVISRLIPNLLKDRYGLIVETNLRKLSFGSDPQSVPPLMNTEFFFERRIDAPYSTRYFYASAPLQTDVHVEFLREFEQAVLNAT